MWGYPVLLFSGVEEVNPLKQSATVTRMRSNSCKILRESKCGDSRRAKTAWRQLTGSGLQCWPMGGWKLTQGNLSKVDASLKEIMPELGFAAEPICNPVRCIHPLQGAAFRKGNQEPRHCLVVCSSERRYRKCPPQWPAI